MDSKKRLTDKRLKKLYELMSEQMMNFDCGSLCAEENDGKPICCDEEQTIPLLFTEEFHWHRERSNFWREMPTHTDEYKELAREHADCEDVLALCPGPAKCDRNKRALVCRIFPFEPHVAKDGTILGLTYNFTDDLRCPLIGKKENIYRDEYIQKSLEFWKKLFKLFPEEKELYMEESRKLRREFKRKRKRIPLFK